MTNKTLVSIIAIIIVAALGIWAYLHYQPQVQDPSAVVENFYSNWINASTSPLAAGAYRNLPELTDNAKASIDSIARSSFNQGAYDPVLCSQTKPLSFQANTQQMDATSAQVMVVENFASTTTNVLVSLTQDNNNTWKINDFACSPAGDPNIQNQVSNYIQQNIGKLSPTPAASSSSFTVDDIRYLDANHALVNYDDGINAYQAQVTFSASTTATTTSIKINSFTLQQDVPSDAKG